MSITLRELILAVKEQNLTKTDLEKYRDAMSDLFANMQLEIAQIEKSEALFMNAKDDNKSVAQRKIEWKATPEGLRLIELKRYCLATKEMLNSLKSRLYQIF
jgi:hypothetical protein